MIASQDDGHLFRLEPFDRLRQGSCAIRYVVEVSEGGIALSFGLLGEVKLLGSVHLMAQGPQTVCQPLLGRAFWRASDDRWMDLPLDARAANRSWPILRSLRFCSNPD